MFLSIIISVYNLENYIQDAVDSILIQDCDDYEIVLVDDGSVDGSSEICLKYAEENNHIMYVKKNNGGASSARNLGLAEARGKYVIFMDGDDFLMGTSSFSELFTKVEASPDIVIYGCMDYDNITETAKVTRSNYDIAKKSLCTKEQIINNLIENNNFPGAAWLFCVEREFLVKNRISFREGIKAEDLDWIFSVFLHAENIAFLNTPFYLYRKNRVDSVTKNFDRKSVDGLLYFIEKWGRVVLANKEMRRMASIINFHFILLVFYADNLTKKDLEILNTNKRILSYPRSLLLVFPSLFIKIIGIKISNFIFRKILSYGRAK